MGVHAARFFEAAQQLAANLSTSTGSVDLAVLPTLYVFRHAVELSLKQLVRFNEAFAPDDRIPGHGHQLQKRWSAVRELVEESNFEHGFEAPMTLAEMDELIAELEAIDGRGDALRYPDSRQGQPHVIGPKFVNVTQVRDTIDLVAETFGTWIDQIAPSAVGYHEYRTTKSVE